MPGPGDPRPLGHDRGRAADPDGHHRGARSGRPGRPPPRGGPRRPGRLRRSPSGNRISTSPASSTCWARRMASRSADSRWTGKAPTAGRMRASVALLPQAVLGHVVELAVGDLGGHEEVDEGPVDGGDDDRALGRDQPRGMHRGPEDEAVQPVHQHPQDPVERGEAGVDPHLDAGARSPAPRPGRRRRRPALGPVGAHSHATTSSTISSTPSAPVSMTRAPSGTSSGDAARVLSSLSRRATAAAPSSERRAARTSGEAVR